MGEVTLSEEDLFRFVALMNSEDPLLYFIQSGPSGPIKIGVSKNIGNRLNQLQTGHHEKLTVVGICKGGYFEESQIHKAFKSFHIKGEWYEPDVKILEYIIDNSLIRSNQVTSQIVASKKEVLDKAHDPTKKNPSKRSSVKTEGGVPKFPAVKGADGNPLVISVEAVNALPPIHRAFAKGLIQGGSLILASGGDIDAIRFQNDELVWLGRLLEISEKYPESNIFVDMMALRGGTQKWF